MIGDGGFGGFDGTGTGEFIEIPWSEIDNNGVGLFQGALDPRIQVVTKKNGVTSLRLRNPRSSSS